MWHINSFLTLPLTNLSENQHNKHRMRINFTELYPLYNKVLNFYGHIQIIELKKNRNLPIITSNSA